MPSKHQNWVIALSVITSLCIVPFLICPICFIDEDPADDLPALIVLIVSLILFPSCFCLAKFIGKDYRLKYLFARKSYKEQYEALAPHFASLSPKNRKEFEKNCKTSYLLTGELLNRNYFESSEIYKNRNQMEILSKMVDALCESVENGTGWVEFIDLCDKGTFVYRRREPDEDINDGPLEGWEIHGLIGGVLFSRGFRYMTTQIQILTSFTFRDNGLSEKWTKENNEHRNIVEKEYNPILFSYKDELYNLQEKLHRSINETK